MLESRYAPLLDVTDRFDRRSVSYQLSKNEILHSWLKYKEGFSADLVQLLLHEMGAHPGDLVMDPFMGSGTTALVCQMQGINSIGYDVMPIADVSLKAKAACMEYDLPELRAMLEELKSLHMPDSYSLKHLVFPSHRMPTRNTTNATFSSSKTGVSTVSIQRMPKIFFGSAFSILWNRAATP